MESSAELFGSFYEKGMVVFRQGEVGDTMYIVQSGAVEVSQNQDGREVVLAILEKGDFFGEMALFQAEKRSATVRAVHPSRLLPLTRAALLEKIRADPGVTFHFFERLVQKIQDVDRQLKQLVMDDYEVLAVAMEGSESESVDSLLGQAIADEPRDEKSTGPGVMDVSIEDMSDIWQAEGVDLWLEVDETLFNEGDPGDCMYIVLEGVIEISQGSGQERYVQRRVEAGEIFGEWAIITDQPRYSSAMAVERTHLLPITRSEFQAQMQARPNLAFYVIRDLCLRLEQVSQALVNPEAAVEIVRQRWEPLIKKHEPIKLAIVSLSSCAGCSAVLLDNEVLAEILDVAEICYCPMLMDREEIPEVDVVLAEGVVRLKEEIETLEEARRKSQLLVAWGTCAAFGGIPAEANRHELEDLIEASYGETSDLFAQYLSGQSGVGRATFQGEQIALLRNAFKVDDFVKVDYYVSGCPPPASQLLLLLGELTGETFGKPKPVVCGQCSRKPAKTSLIALDTLPATAAIPEDVCFNSLGTPCLGFLIYGGCDAICPNAGLPCWGCRGPAKVTLKKISQGDSFEEVVIDGLMRRCKLDENQVAPIIKQMRRQGHGLFDFEASFSNRLARVR